MTYMLKKLQADGLENVHGEEASMSHAMQFVEQSFVSVL